MTEQATLHSSPAVEAFLGLLRAHAAVTRELSAELLADHGLTLNDYEALFRLSLADEQRMRRVDLARRLLLTPSGVTRLLDGLERAGLVSSVECPSDRRVTWAQLTPAGAERLQAARAAHVTAIDALFREHLTTDETQELATLLAKLPGGDAEDACAA